MFKRVDEWCSLAFEKVFGEYEGYGYYQEAVRYLDRYKAEIFGLALIFFIKIFFFNINFVPSGSMNPSIVEGDIVLVNKIASRMRSAEYGDVITFDKNGTYYVKRVVGMPGDKIEVINGSLYVNDELTHIDEQAQLVEKNAFPAAKEIPFISNISKIADSRPFRVVQADLRKDDDVKQKRRELYEQGHYHFDSPKFIVPEGQLFVMGDNRLTSRDSRYPEFGYVPAEDVEGYLVSVLFNIKHIAINAFNFLQGKPAELPVRAGLSMYTESPQVKERPKNQVETISVSSRT